MKLLYRCTMWDAVVSPGTGVGKSHISGLELKDFTAYYMAVA